jgi:hypothetical protein
MMRTLQLSLAFSLAFGLAPAWAQKAAAAAPSASTTATSATAAGKPTPGLWEISTVNDRSDSPGKRTVVARVCFSAEDVSQAARLIPPQHEFGTKCENRDIKVKGAAISWQTACTGKLAMTGTGHLTLGEESYSAHADFTTKVEGKPGKLAQETTAKRVGDCR